MSVTSYHLAEMIRPAGAHSGREGRALPAPLFLLTAQEHRPIILTRSRYSNNEHCEASRAVRVLPAGKSQAGSKARRFWLRMNFF